MKPNVREKAELLDRQFKGRVIEVPTPIEQLSYDEIMWLCRNDKGPVLIRYSER